MSQLFNGTSGEAEWTKGSVVGTGQITFAAIVKFTGSTGDWGSILTLEDNVASQRLSITRSGGSSQVILTTNNEATVSGGGTTFGSAQGWSLIAISKPLGTAFASFTIYPLAGSPTSTTASDAQIPNSAAWNRIVFGNYLGIADWWPGHVAALAIYDTALNQSNRESLGSTMTRANWLSKGPVFLVDADDVFQTDYAGTSTRTAIAGNSSSADDPPGWSSWAGSTTQVTQQPPMIVGGQAYQDRSRW